VIHTHGPEDRSIVDFSPNPDHSNQYDRWMIIGVMTSGGELIAKWVPNPSSKLPAWARTEGTIHPTELEPRLASDNVRIEVAA